MGGLCSSLAAGKIDIAAAVKAGQDAMEAVDSVVKAVDEAKE